MPLLINSSMLILLVSLTVDCFDLLNLVHDRLVEDASMRRSYDGLLWTLRYGVQVFTILNLQQVPSYILFTAVEVFNRKICEMI